MNPAPSAFRQQLLGDVPRLRRCYARSLGLRLDLRAARARLSPEQREPLLLVCMEQLS